MKPLYRFWESLDRFWLHVPVGWILTLAFWLNPWFGAGFLFLFWRYEKNEDRYLRDQAWRDYMGALWGLGMGTIAWTVLRIYG